MTTNTTSALPAPTDAERTAFERTISGPPYERNTERWPDDHTSAWPGNYKDYPVDLAWALWQERAALAATPPAEIARLQSICVNAHDRLLRADSDQELLALLATAWEGSARPEAPPPVGTPGSLFGA